jgi:hypothetical protein
VRQTILSELLAQRNEDLVGDAIPVRFIVLRTS